MANEISSAGTYLVMRSLDSGAIPSTPKIATSSSSKLADYKQVSRIKDTPDFGGEPEAIDITDLSDTKTNRNMSGLESLSTFNFTCNFTRDEYTVLQAIEDGNGQYAFGVIFSDGTIIEWIGKLKVYMKATSVNSVIEANINISAMSEPKMSSTQLASTDIAKLIKVASTDLA